MTFMREEKKSVVFIPSYYYLSNNSYFNIARHLRGSFNLVYFNTNDPFYTYKSNKDGIQKDEILKHFDEFITMPNDPWIHSKRSNIVKLAKIWRWYRLKRDIESVLEKISPSAIVCSTDVGGFTVQVCNEWTIRRNIPFIYLQSSLIEYKIPRYSLRQRLQYIILNKILGLPFERKQNQECLEYDEDHYIFWSRFFLEKNKGRGSKKRYIAGNYNSEFNVERSKDRVIAICTQPIEEVFGQEYAEMCIRSFADLAKANKDRKFIVKVHPREDITKYEKAFSGMKNCSVIRKMTLRELVSKSDLMIGICSNIALDFVAAGVPIILIDFPPSDRFVDYYDHKIELRAKDSRELISATRKALSKRYLAEFRKKRERYLLGFFGKEPDKENTLKIFRKIIG